EREGVLVGEVPGVAGELALDAVGDAGGTEETQRALTRGEQPPELVEAHEVIHVGVRHEDRPDRQQHAARGAVDAPEVDENGAPLPAQRDEQRRIAGLSVQQARAQRGLRHGEYSREVRVRVPPRWHYHRWSLARHSRYTRAVRDEVERTRGRS